MDTDTDFSQILKTARSDPTLMSQLNVNALLESLDDKNDHLANKTLDDISEEVYDALSSLSWLPPEKRKEFCNHLLEYRYVEHINEIHIGKYIRILRINPVPENVDEAKIIPGGFVLKVFFTQNGGSYLFCRNVNEKTYTYKFNNFMFFQKLSTDEQMILAINEEMNSENDSNSDDDDKI